MTVSKKKSKKRTASKIPVESRASAPALLAVEVIHPEKLALVVAAPAENIQELVQHKDSPQTFFEKLKAWWWNHEQQAR